jgi:hypothetical protein
MTKFLTALLLCTSLSAQGFNISSNSNVGFSNWNGQDAVILWGWRNVISSFVLFHPPAPGQIRVALDVQAILVIDERSCNVYHLWGIGVNSSGWTTNIGGVIPPGGNSIYYNTQNGSNWTLEYVDCGVSCQMTGASYSISYCPTPLSCVSGCNSTHPEWFFIVARARLL